MNSFEILLAVVTLVISLSALILSIINFFISKQQFFLSNQSYLSIAPNLGFSIPKNNSIVANPVMDKANLVEGLNFSVDLKNIGKIPLIYDVEQFTVVVNELESKLENEANTIGTLYPEQELNFHLKTLPLNFDRSGVIFSNLQKIPIKVFLKIKYHDLGLKHDKYITREFEWKIFDNAISYIYTKFDDSI
jgi:hypothetical protein